MNEEAVTLAVAKAIRKAREEGGWTQEIFAHLAPMDRSFYGRVERGKQNLALVTLCRVAGALGVHPSRLLDGIDPIDLPPPAPRPNAEEEWTSDA